MDACAKEHGKPECEAEAMKGTPSEDCCTAAGKSMECMGKDCFMMAMGMAMSMDKEGNMEKVIKGYTGCANMEGITVDSFKDAGKKAMTPPKAKSEESEAGGATTCSAKAAAALTTLVAAKVLA